MKQRNSEILKTFFYKDYLVIYLVGLYKIFEKIY
jgi:hypothetical protein